MLATCARLGAKRATGATNEFALSVWPCRGKTSVVPLASQIGQQKVVHRTLVPGGDISLIRDEVNVRMLAHFIDQHGHRHVVVKAFGVAAEGLANIRLFHGNGGKPDIGMLVGEGRV